MPASPDTADDRPVIVVVGTGGTIASITDQRRGRVPLPAGDGVNGEIDDVPSFAIRRVPAFSLSSFALTPTELNTLRDNVSDHLEDPRVVGIVITHGTDTLEETAYFLHLIHADARPVVLTGAIRPADDPVPDGPSNLRDAITVAASPSARNRGVLVVFGGRIYSAAGVRKVDTTDGAAFDSPDVGPTGSLGSGPPVFLDDAPLTGPTPVATSKADLSSVRVDIVATYPGGDDVALRAQAAAGAQALVLEGMGSGNIPPALTSAVSALSAAGVIIVLSSRVHRGPIAALYGGLGGGRELAAAGAIPAGWLRPSQARIALLVLLAHHRDHSVAREKFVSLSANQ